MADARLQQLRRAWDEGDLDAQVRLLRERMRTGELSEERVRVVAVVGWKPACLVLGREADRPVGLILESLERESQETRVRVAIAATRALDELRREWEQTTQTEWKRLRPRECLHTAEVCCVRPSTEVAQQARSLGLNSSFSSKPVVSVPRSAALEAADMGGLHNSVWEAISATSEAHVREILVADLVPWASVTPSPSGWRHVNT
jgi:hypothetical protein